MFNQKNMLSQLKKMQQEVLKIQEDLKNEKIEGKAGEGKVTVTLNGHHEVQSVHLDPSLLNPDDAEIVEDLLVVAFRDAFEKVKDVSARKLGPLTGGMGIPGF
jgi:DNA-binding YbaB/EbfC family protein